MHVHNTYRMKHILVSGFMWGRSCDLCFQVSCYVGDSCGLVVFLYKGSIYSLAEKLFGVIMKYIKGENLLKDLLASKLCMKDSRAMVVTNSLMHLIVKLRYRDI